MLPLEVPVLTMQKLTAFLLFNWPCTTEKTSLSFEALVLPDMSNNQSRLKWKHQRKNPRLWLGFFQACLMSLVYVIYDSLRHSAKILCWLPLSQAPHTIHLGWAMTLLPVCRDPPAAAAAAASPKEQHAWLLEHLFSTTEMQHLTFVWTRCKYLLRNSLWERGISHDRATHSRWPTVLFASLVTALSFFFF